MSDKPLDSPLDYLVIGHITRDLVKDGFRLGGTAVYASLVAQRMGLKVGLYTSFESDLDLEMLEGIEIYNQDSSSTTTFTNHYSEAGRTQFLSERAPDLDLEQLPKSWKRARVIHLAPVAGEVSLESGRIFKLSPVYYSLQGWLRSWDADGLVEHSRFPDVAEIPGYTGAGFLSIEDLGYDRSQLDRLRDLFPELILTLGADGSEIYQPEKMIQITSPATEEIDPTGSGDIFAAAFIIDKVIRRKQTLESARFASSLASLSTTRQGLEGIPTAAEIKEIQKVHNQWD
jgi:1D-myo-inositol 3-kinase